MYEWDEENQKLIVKYENVFHVAADFIVIEAEPYDEIVRDFHGHVFERNILPVDIRFEQKGADAGRCRPFLGKHSFQFGNGIAGIHDVFHDDDASSPDVGIKSENFADRACTACPGIGGKLDREQFAVESEPLHEFGSEKNGSVEHAQDNRNVFAVLEIIVQFRCYLVNGFLDFFVGNESPESLVE